MLDFSKYTTEIAQVMTAALGGLISIMLRHEVKGIGDVLWGIAGSAFAGKSVAWLCSGLGVNSDLTMFFVSVAGWVGANEAMRFFQNQIKKRFDQKENNENGQ